YAYSYDLADRLTSETDNGTTTSYGYDAANELTSAGTYAYSYDLAGNRTMTGYTTGPGNQQTNDGTYAETYDAAGNLTKRSKGAGAETWTYGYDNKNRLVWVEERATDGGTLLMRADYAYDTDGNRVSKAVDPDGAGAQPTTTTHFAFDGQ